MLCFSGDTELYLIMWRKYLTEFLANLHFENFSLNPSFIITSNNFVICSICFLNVFENINMSSM